MKYEKRLLSARTSEKAKIGRQNRPFPFKLGASITLHHQYVPGWDEGTSRRLGGKFDPTKT